MVGRAQRHGGFAKTLATVLRRRKCTLEQNAAWSFVGTCNYWRHAMYGILTFAGHCAGAAMTWLSAFGNALRPLRQLSLPIAFSAFFKRCAEPLAGSIGQ
jgi:hypothetical protein